MISTMDSKHLELVKKLRKNVSDVVPREQLKDDHFLFRWLQARDLNLAKAEAMLRKACAWARRNEFDSLLDWKPVDNYFRYAVAGNDLDGSPVFILPFGLWDFCGAAEQGDIVPSFKCILRLLAHFESEIKISAQRFQKPVTQVTLIADFQQCSYLRLLGNRSVVQAVIEFCRIFESNFPEILKSCIIINTARVFPLCLAITKPFISGKTMSKLQIFGSQRKKWIPAIEKLVPMNILPPHYGGTRAGADEYCSNSEIWNDEPLPQDFFNNNGANINSSRRRSSVDFGSCEAWKREEIEAGGKLQLSFPVSLESAKASTQQLVWQVKSEDYDLGFQVTFKGDGSKLNNEVDDIIKYQRIDSHVRPSAGSVLCDQPGTYTLTLDNSYSRRRKKMVLHNVFLSTIDDESFPDLTTSALNLISDTS